MCGICGAIDIKGNPISDLDRRLEVMSALISHRGPDDDGMWTHHRGHVGLAHRRLSIVDLNHGHQPMSDEAGRWITYNGEIYNHPELRREIGAGRFTTKCDTEVLLRAHGHWGLDSLDRLRGMFAYAIWDEPADELVCARDRLGIKPFYYTVSGGVLYFASEAKALLPFLPDVETDVEALKDYLAFQFCLDGKTLFAGIRELLPGHYLRVNNGHVRAVRYWEVFYKIDRDHSSRHFEQEIDELLRESVRLHMRSDVPVSTYLSGGLDSSSVASLAAMHSNYRMKAFTGRFREDARYDESHYARRLARSTGLDHYVVDIGVADFLEMIESVIHHMDYPAAGPGAFAQFMVSQAASQEGKVILGGAGGDEVFGGYVRYLIAYFEQCVKGAIDGTMSSGNFVVPYESIIPNLVALQNYKSQLKQFWSHGLFEDPDARYFALINRTPDIEGLIDVEALGDYSPFETFREIFNGHNVNDESYFDKMTHFDFKTLLPALLHVEDRVSMAHGLESRVPLLDHVLVELAATIPADIKFKGGELKRIFKKITRRYVPKQISDRTDKMGFPVPLPAWFRGAALDFVREVFAGHASRGRALINNRAVLEAVDREPEFGRKIWGFLCLELWQREFHDRADSYRRMLTDERVRR